MKALILAGGTGTRLRPLTHSMAKQLVPVANRPVIHYVMDHIARAGLTKVGIIISPETGQQIKESLGNGDFWKVNITYIRQEHPSGLAHAVKTAKPFLKESPFLMFLGDNLIKDGVNQLVEQYKERKPAAAILLKKVPNPESFGVARVDESLAVVELAEKPIKPSSNLAIIGIYAFSPSIHSAIDRIKPSSRGELEITDAIQELINLGHSVQACEAKGWWIDTGKKEDLLKANKTILFEKATFNNEGEADSDSIITGRVQIGKGTTISASTIIGPVIIGNKCSIENSFIGPYTSIGNESLIKGTKIDNSIVMEKCLINQIERLTYSILGTNTQISRDKEVIKTTSMFLGNDSQVIL